MVHSVACYMARTYTSAQHMSDIRILIKHKINSRMSSDIHVSKFDPTKAKDHRVWLIIGCRGSGKSVLLKDLLHQTRSKYDVGLAMTATETTAQTLRKIFPPSLVINTGYDYNAADRFMRSAKEMSKITGHSVETMNKVYVKEQQDENEK